MCPDFEDITKMFVVKTLITKLIFKKKKKTVNEGVAHSGPSTPEGTM